MLSILGAIITTGCILEKDGGTISINADDTGLSVCYPSIRSDSIDLKISNTHGTSKSVTLLLDGDIPTEMKISIAGGIHLEVPPNKTVNVTLIMESKGFCRERGTLRFIAATRDEKDGIDICWEGSVPAPADTLPGHIGGHMLIRAQDISYSGFDAHVRGFLEPGNWSMVYSSGGVQMVVIDCETADQASELLEKELPDDLGGVIDLNATGTNPLGFGLNDLAKTALATLGYPSGVIGFSQSSNRQTCTIGDREVLCWWSQLHFYTSRRELELFGKDSVEVGTLTWKDGCYIYVVSGGPFEQIESIAESLPAPLPHEGTPGGFHGRWERSGKAVEDCYPDEEISLNFILQAVGGYVRKNIRIEIIAEGSAFGNDIPLYDHDVSSRTLPLELEEGNLSTTEIPINIPWGSESILAVAYYEDIKVYQTPADEGLHILYPVIEATARFEQGGVPVEVVELKSPVTARATLGCREGYARGQAQIQVLKDYIYWDEVVGQKTIDYDLRGGESVELVLEFSPDHASTKLWSRYGPNFRGYFIRVRYDEGEMEMGNDYPPRLYVKSYIEIADLHFEVDGVEVEEVPVGASVSAKARILGSRGAVNGRVTLQVRSETVSGSDAVFAEDSFTYTIKENQSKVIEISFYASPTRLSDHRGFYIRVVSDEKEVIMDDSYPPRLKIQNVTKLMVVPEGSPRTTKCHVFEVNPEGGIVWEIETPTRAYDPIDADPLPNGNTMVVSRVLGVLEVNRTGDIIRRFDPENAFSDAEYMKNGNVMVASWNSEEQYLREYDWNGTIVGEIKIGDIPGGKVEDVELLPNGNILVANGRQVIEVYGNGTVVLVWQQIWGLRGVLSAKRLDSGNTLITLDWYQADWVLEISPEKNSVWKCGPEICPQCNWWTPIDAERLPDGDTLIVNYWNRSIIQVSREGEIVWELDQLGFVMDADLLPGGNILASVYPEKVPLAILIPAVMVIVVVSERMKQPNRLYLT